MKKTQVVLIIAGLGLGILLGIIAERATIGGLALLIAYCCLSFAVGFGVNKLEGK